MSSTVLSIVPCHLPIALQPSTQSCRVIWVRIAIARSAATESDSGRRTRPVTAIRQSAKRLAACARYAARQRGQEEEGFDMLSPNGIQELKVASQSRRPGGEPARPDQPAAPISG